VFYFNVFFLATRLGVALLGEVVSATLTRKPAVGSYLLFYLKFKIKLNYLFNLFFFKVRGCSQARPPRLGVESAIIKVASPRPYSSGEAI
jgi:hypothetical protein